MAWPYDQQQQQTYPMQGNAPYSPSAPSWSDMTFGTQAPVTGSMPGYLGPSAKQASNLDFGGGGPSVSGWSPGGGGGMNSPYQGMGLTSAPAGDASGIAMPGVGYGMPAGADKVNKSLFADSQTTTPSFWESYGKGIQGVGSVLQGAGNMYLGMENLKLSKDALATQKRQFSDQFDVQKKLTNQDIAWQGKARYDASGGRGQDADAYYKENKI